jgi:stearoyl-CoA desaturase (delta-9 desaturase)
MAGMPGLVWGFLAPTVLLFQTTFLVSGWGTRRYDTKDDSRNNW